MIMSFFPQKDSEEQLNKGFLQTDEFKNHNMLGDFYVEQFKDPAQPKNILNLAINEYTKEIEINDDPDLLVKLSRAYLLNGKLETAEKYINKALKKDNIHSKTTKKAFEILALLKSRQGKPLETLQSLKTALKHEKLWNRSRLHFSIVSAYGVIIQEKNSIQQWLALLGHCLAAILLLPFSFLSVLPNKPLLTLYITALLNYFKSPEEQLTTYLKLYNRYPGLSILPVVIGKIYLQQEQFSEAEFWFNRAIYRHPSRDEGYRYLVKMCQQTYQTQQLTDTLQNWLLVRPKSGEILAALGYAISEQPNKHEEALSYIKQAILYLKQPYMLANAYMHMGNIYQSIQLTDAAITAYQAAITIYPGLLEIYIQLGTLYHEKQEYLLSQAIFEKAQQFAPDNPKILCNLGYLAWMQGDIARAQGYYHQSVALDSAYDIALNNLGVLYLDHIGNVEKAMELFDQTLHHNPNYALCHYNKGRAYSFLGKNIEAARCFRQAQELNEQSQELDNQELTERIKSLFENPESIDI